jgi:hypothetical protein
MLQPNQQMGAFANQEQVECSVIGVPSTSTLLEGPGRRADLSAKRVLWVQQLPEKEAALQATAFALLVMLEAVTHASHAKLGPIGKFG